MACIMTHPKFIENQPKIKIKASSESLEFNGGMGLDIYYDKFAMLCTYTLKFIIILFEILPKLIHKSFKIIANPSNTKIKPSSE